jgi:hypothetical protein
MITGMITGTITGRIAALGLRIEFPLFAPGLRIQGNDPAGRRGQIQNISDFERRSLERREPLPPHVGGRFDLLAGVIGPDTLEPIYVSGIDLPQWRIARAARIVAISRPVRLSGQQTGQE